MALYFYLTKLSNPCLYAFPAVLDYSIRYTLSGIVFIRAIPI